MVATFGPDIGPQAAEATVGAAEALAAVPTEAAARAAEGARRPTDTGWASDEHARRAPLPVKVPKSK
jgi:hypothetical protein